MSRDGGDDDVVMEGIQHQVHRPLPMGVDHIQRPQVDLLRSLRLTLLRCLEVAFVQL